MIVEKFDTVVSALLRYIENLPLHTGDVAPALAVVGQMQADLEATIQAARGGEIGMAPEEIQRALTAMEEIKQRTWHWHERLLTLAARQQQLRAHMEEEAQDHREQRARYHGTEE